MTLRLFFVLALVVGFLIYGTGLWAPFHLDDTSVISGSQGIGSWTPDHIRALGYFSFWLNRQIFLTLGSVLPWAEPFYYRFINVIIHALAATALFGFIRELTQKWQLAAAGGGLFLVHPIQTQAVTYISQRFESQAALFMFLSAAAYVRFRRTKTIKWVAAAALFGIAAALTKETAVILPLWLCLIEIAFFEGAALLRRCALYLFGLFILLLIPGIRAFQSDTKNLFGWVPWHQYFFTQGPVLTKYFELASWPRRQFLFYDFPLVTTFSWIVVLQWFLVVTVVGLGIYFLKRNTLLGFGILSFFIFLLPVLLLPLPDLINEHRLYGAFAGVAIAVDGCIQAINRKWAFAAVGLLIVLFGVKTARRNFDWNDQLYFLELHHAAFPQDPQILSRLASYYYASGYVNRSIELNLEARRYEDRFNTYYSQEGRTLIAINLATGYLAKGNDKAAETEARRAIAASPNQGLAWRVLGYVLLQERRYAEATSAFRKYAELSSAPEGWANVQTAGQLAGDSAAAKLAADKIKAEEDKAHNEGPQGVQVPEKYKGYAIFGLTLSVMLAIALAVWTVWTDLGALRRKARISISGLS